MKYFEGQRVLDLHWGFGTIDRVREDHITVHYELEGRFQAYEVDGRKQSALQLSTYPVLLTLEEAETIGYLDERMKRQ